MISNSSQEDIFNDYKLELTLSAELPIKGDEDQYLNPIQGKIFYYDEAKEEYEPEECGRLRCKFVNVIEIENNEHSLFQILDTNADLAEVYALFDPTEYDVTKAARKALKLDDRDIYISESNFIYIDRLEIIEEHRGNGIGIYFLEQALSYLSKTLRFRYFVMTPCPLQSLRNRLKEVPDSNDWVSKMAYNKLEQSRPKALKKLRTIYSEIGFTLVKGTQLMVCKADDFYEI